VMIYNRVFIECIVVCWFTDADSTIGYIVLEDVIVVGVHDYTCIDESVAEYRGI